MTEIQTCPRCYTCPGYLQVWKRLWSNMKALRPGQCQTWAFLHSRSSNCKKNCTMWPKFELGQDLLSVLDPHKLVRVAIKTEGALLLRRWNINSTQGHHTCPVPESLKQFWSKGKAISPQKVQIRVFEDSRTNFLQFGRDFMPVVETCKFETVTIKNEGALPRTRSNMCFLVAQR